MGLSSFTTQDNNSDCFHDLKHEMHFLSILICSAIPGNMCYGDTQRLVSWNKDEIG